MRARVFSLSLSSSLSMSHAHTPGYLLVACKLLMMESEEKTSSGMNDKYHKKEKKLRERESESEANRQTKKKKKTNLFFVKQRTFVEHIDPNHSKMSIDHQDHYYRQHHSWLMKDPFLCLMNLHCHLAHTYLHKDDAKNFEKIKDMRWEKKEF